MDTQHDISRAIEAVSNGDFLQGLLDVLNKMVADNAALELVAKLVQNERKNCTTDADAVSNTMLRLESLGNASPPIACVLMVHLWPMAAGGLFLHEVCDRIDLWIWDTKSPELARQLKLIVSSEADPDTRRHYEQWLQSMEISQ